MATSEPARTGLIVMSEGLEGVIAARTILSDVDGEAGRLVIRGFDVETLSRHRTITDVAHLLWKGFFDDLPDTKALQTRLGAARKTAFE